MSIERTCENCVHDDYNYCGYCVCEYCEENSRFAPREELVREDERAKIITDLENEIQNFNEVRDSRTIDFIYDFIKELKEEQK